MKLLIVDDSENSRMLLEAILAKAGYSDIVCASSAARALRILDDDLAGHGGSGFDCVLMDIVMPEMDGIEATRAIKSRKALADLPVVIVTVRDEDDTLERAFNAGASDYIHKPFSKTELLARVRSVLRLKREIDERKRRELQLERLTAKLEELSNLDGLTGVSNRRHFDYVYDREWRRSLREGHDLSLLMIDIDRFKKYNDNHGHLAGDECLRQVARCISEALRRPGDFVARFGGEEFVAVLPGSDMDGASILALSISDAIERLAMPHGDSDVADHVTVSIGISSDRPTHDDEPTALVHAADKALYQAKWLGRNRIEKAT